ncbi:hypothetical protein EG68_03705 [Paragonimus skrjabini miyazakii]|uniref:Serine/threonine-protein phosphatase 4 regulatory subunit 2 n=1 Tax=Paragonimus skrjabini miyazakii TaxID=59628 RepID=A0A8S9YW24_9TREM|nr:hypothetical protein EG68_03705 [Paragonimus skrjabini miyazakii]
MTLLPMENREGILCALKCFGKEKPNNIPPILEDYIKQIARNGQTMLPWVYIKPLLLHKYNKVVDSLIIESGNSDFLPPPASLTELRQQVFDTLKRLDGIPFTIQRICELFENPFRHYNRPDKFLRGLEKVCMVVTTVDPQGDKLHREDPRFPSQAGMDEYDVVGDAVLSLPSSPSVDDLHRQQTSKSSDDEEVTDEDEDEEDENQTENSSHGSSTSPQESTSLGQPPMLSSTSAPGVWPFETNHMGDSALSKQQFRNLVLTSTQRVDPNSALVSSPCSNSPSERPDGSAKESSSFSPEAESVCDELTRKQSSFLAKKRIDIGPLFTAHEMEAAAVISKSPTTHLNATECNSDSSPLKSSAGISVEESAKTCTTSPPVCSKAKRRASPVHDLDSPNQHLSDPNGRSSAEISEPHQSPAKRRRLIETSPFTPESGSQTSVGTPPTALNDSPPIIVCNPVSQNRDLEFSERTSCASPLTDEHSLKNTEAVPDSDMETDGATTVNSPAALSSGTPHPHIEIETEEEDM